MGRNTDTTLFVGVPKFSNGSILYAPSLSVAARRGFVVSRVAEFTDDEVRIFKHFEYRAYYMAVIPILYGAAFLATQLFVQSSEPGLILALTAVVCIALSIIGSFSLFRTVGRVADSAKTLSLRFRSSRVMIPLEVMFELSRESYFNPSGLTSEWDPFDLYVVVRHGVTEAIKDPKYTKEIQTCIKELVVLAEDPRELEDRYDDIKLWIIRLYDVSSLALSESSQLSSGEALSG